jgi:4-hydroxy-tetrahydrodipicolinate synthase
MRLTGTLTAIVTPFRDDYTIDEDALREHIHHQLEGGLDGIVPCGTTGETPTLSPAECEQVIRITIEEVAGRIPVIAGTGSNNTRTAVETTRRALELGVDAALVVTPYYNKPGPAMLEAHYRRVAAEGGLPVVLYNVPGRTGCNMNAATVATLSRVDGIIAVKEASGNLSQVQEILGSTDPSTFTVVSGDDGLALPMYSVGAHGVISVASNVVPKKMRAVHTHYLAGDVEAASNLNAQLFPLYQALFCESNPVPCKSALAMLGRMTDTVRSPLGPLKTSSIETVRSAMVGLGLL